MANQVAYGFIDSQHLFSSRIDAIGVEKVYDMVRASAAEYSRVANEMIEVMFERTEMAQAVMELSGSGELQPLTPSGEILPIKPSASYPVAFPILGGGTGWGVNRVSKEMLTIEEANNLAWNAQQRDAAWLTRQMRGAILRNTTWIFSDKYGNGSSGLGDLTIQPLALASDGVTYDLIGGVPSATDTHYLAQANAIDNSNNPFPEIREELEEHPSNSGPFIAYISISLRASIEALSTFVEVADPNLIYGDEARAINVPDPAWGSEIIGYIKGENVWIALDRGMPAGYMIVHATGAGPVGKMREFPAANLKGFYPEKYVPAQGLEQMNMLRWAGFGVSNRVAAVAVRIGNGTYATPAGYAAPV